MSNNTKEIFKSKGIVKGKVTKALEIFSELTDDFTVMKSMEPSEYIDVLWRKYLDNYKEDGSVNGKVFEYLIISLLINKNILPIYVQAKVAFVPNVDFDLLLYTDEKPIAISAKTSLRERYKQADLEAIALKYVHRKAECFLITMNEVEHRNINLKIKTGDVIGLDKCYLANSKEFDDLITDLKSLPLKQAGSVEVVTAMSIVE